MHLIKVILGAFFFWTITLLMVGSFIRKTAQESLLVYILKLFNPLTIFCAIQALLVTWFEPVGAGIGLALSAVFFTISRRR